MCRPAQTGTFNHVAEHYDVIIAGSGAGGGTLASIGAVNPALTAMANAIRVGEHLLGRMA